MIKQIGISLPAYGQFSVERQIVNWLREQGYVGECQLPPTARYYISKIFDSKVHVRIAYREDGKPIDDDTITELFAFKPQSITALNPIWGFNERQQYNHKKVVRNSKRNSQGITPCLTPTKQSVNSTLKGEQLPSQQKMISNLKSPLMSTCVSQLRLLAMNLKTAITRLTSLAKKQKATITAIAPLAHSETNLK